MPTQRPAMARMKPARPRARSVPAPVLASAGSGAEAGAGAATAAAGFGAAATFGAGAGLGAGAGAGVTTGAGVGAASGAGDPGLSRATAANEAVRTLSGSGA